MSTMVLQPTDEHPAPGNLRAHVCGDRLCLPKEVVAALHGEGVRTAEDLLSYIMAFPSSLAYTLHWSIGDVSNAEAQLCKELQGHVPADRLIRQSRPNPPLGARDPDSLR